MTQGLVTSKCCITIQSKEHLWLVPCVLGRVPGGVEVLDLDLVGGGVDLDLVGGGVGAGSWRALGLARSAIVETVSPESRQEMMDAR